MHACSEVILFHLTAQFTVQPVSVERAEGLEAVFRCQYQAEEGLTVTYDWSINSSLVTTDTETVRARPPSFPGGATTLTILATPQQNNSDVQCLTIFRNGTAIVRSEASATATLTVYSEFFLYVNLQINHYTVATDITDILSAPNTIIVMWSALPLTNYCVNIFRATLDSNETVVFDSVCGLANEYMFMYSNRSVCDRFSFTVTPTEGEMRGTTSKPDTGFFQTARGVCAWCESFLLLHFVYNYILCIVGSGERYLIHENGETKSIEFRIEASLYYT